MHTTNVGPTCILDRASALSPPGSTGACRSVHWGLAWPYMDGPSRRTYDSRSRKARHSARDGTSRILLRHQQCPHRHPMVANASMGNRGSSSSLVLQRRVNHRSVSKQLGATPSRLPLPAGNYSTGSATLMTKRHIGAIKGTPAASRG